MNRLPFSILLIVMASCPAACTTLPATGSEVTLDVAPSSPAYVTVAGVERSGAEDIIQGEAALPLTSRVAGFTGGVEATIEMPGRSTLVFRDVRVVPRPKPRMLGGEAYFTIHTGRILPKGTVVHLVYRNG